MRSRERHADSVVSALLEPFAIEDAQRGLASSEVLYTDQGARRADGGASANGRPAGSARTGRRPTEAAVGEVSSGAGALEAEIESLGEQIEEARRRAERAQTELDAAHQKARLSVEAAKQLKSAEALFEKRLKSLKPIEAIRSRRKPRRSRSPPRQAASRWRARGRKRRAPPLQQTRPT